MSVATRLKEIATEMNDRAGEHGDEAFAMIDRIVNPDVAFAAKAQAVAQLASAELVACSIMRGCAAIVEAPE